MKLRTARLAVILATLLGLIVPTTSPAEADTYKSFTFTGAMVLNKGLAYPCLPAGTTDCITVTTTSKVGPKNEPQVNITPGGNTAAFVLAGALCVKSSSTTPEKPNQKNGFDVCALASFGVITGYCGLSTGAGIVKIIDLASNKSLIDMAFKFTEVGGVLHLSGGDKHTNLYAEVWMSPTPSVPGGPSCTNKTAHSFVLTGVGHYKDCNKGTTAGACNPVAT